MPRSDTQQTGFSAPPTTQVLVGGTGIGAQVISAADQAARVVSGPWGIWFNSIVKRFQFSQISLRTVTGNTTINLADGTVIGSLQTTSIWTLPEAGPIQGRIFHLKNSAGSTNSLSLLATGNQLIDNASASSIVLFPGQAVSLQSDGTNWVVIGRVQ